MYHSVNEGGTAPLPPGDYVQYLVGPGPLLQLLPHPAQQLPQVAAPVNQVYKYTIRNLVVNKKGVSPENLLIFQMTTLVT